MGTFWTLVILVSMTLLVIGIGVIRNFNFKKKHDIFIRFAEKKGLGLSFHNPFNFTFFGKDPKNSLRIEPYRGLIAAQNSVKGVIFSLPIINPEMKALKIVKPHESYTWLTGIMPIDNALKIGHDLGQQVVMHTNDMLFSSYMLSQDIIIDLGVLFNRVEAGIVYVYGDKLGCIIPHFVYEDDMYDTWEKVVELLFNLKAELQV